MLIILINIIVLIIEICIILYIIRFYVNLKEIWKIGILNLSVLFVYIVIYVLYIFAYLIYNKNLYYLISINVIILLILLYRSINLNVEINAAFIKGDNTFRYFHQKDKRWKRIKYGNSTIGNAGCGVAVLSMIHSVPDQNITPGQSAVWICENFQINIGTNTDVMISYLNNIGLENTYLPRNINLLAELKNNAVMCVLVRNKLAKINKLLGYAENHFILLYDIIGDKCRVADPENYSKSLKLRKLRILLKDVNRLPSNITYPYISVRF